MTPDKDDIEYNASLIGRAILFEQYMKDPVFFRGRYPETGSWYRDALPNGVRGRLAELRSDGDRRALKKGSLSLAKRGAIGERLGRTR